MMKSRTGLAALFAATAITAFAGSASAQTLPPAAELVARYQKEVGKDAFASKKFMQTTGEFSMPAQGMGGSIEVFATRPNVTTMRVAIGGIGEFRTGFNGTVAWSMNPMQGPRVMEGAEKQQASDEADFESFLRTPASFTSMETVERTQLGGKDCFKVKLVWKSGRESFDCYSPDTGLLVGTVSNQITDMGAMEAVTTYDEYKDFGGVRMPTKIVVQVMGFDQVLTVKDVKFTDLPPSTFELPAEIKALIK